LSTERCPSFYAWARRVDGWPLVRARRRCSFESWASAEVLTEPWQLAAISAGAVDQCAPRELWRAHENGTDRPYQRHEVALTRAPASALFNRLTALVTMMPFEARPQAESGKEHLLGLNFMRWGFPLMARTNRMAAAPGSHVPSTGVTRRSACSKQGPFQSRFESPLGVLRSN